MFFFLEDHGNANYADDYSAKTNHKLVIEELEKSSSILFKWLQTKHVKVNTDKRHLSLSGNTQLTSNIDNNLITSEKEQMLLGITIDSNRSFEEVINNMCLKASQKLNSLARIACYLDIQKRRTIMKSFITSQFGYCSLVLIFHSRSLNNKINSLYERALRITYGDKTSTFQQLLEKTTVSIHHRNLQTLSTEMVKISNSLSPEIVK